MWKGWSETGGKRGKGKHQQQYEQIQGNGEGANEDHVERGGCDEVQKQSR